MPTREKDPSTRVDFTVDWRKRVPAGDTITSHEVIVTGGGGLELDGSAHADRAVVAWLKGGTHLETGKVLCKVVTEAGLEDEYAFDVQLRNR